MRPPSVLVLLTQALPKTWLPGQKAAISDGFSKLLGLVFTVLQAHQKQFDQASFAVQWLKKK